jgi:hypothetical protein
MTLVDLFKGKYFIINEDGKPQGFDVMGPYCPKDVQNVRLFNSKKEVDQVLAVLEEQFKKKNFFFAAEIKSVGYVVFP